MQIGNPGPSFVTQINAQLPVVTLWWLVALFLNSGQLVHNDQNEAQYFVAKVCIEIVRGAGTKTCQKSAQIVNRAQTTIFARSMDNTQRQMKLNAQTRTIFFQTNKNH